MTSDGGMFYQFRNGSPTFTTYPNELNVSEGNVVEMKIRSGINHGIAVMVSDWRVNTSTSSNGAANVAGAYKVFRLHAGDVLSWEIEPLEVAYANEATGHKTMWLIIRNENGVYATMMNDVVLNTIMSHGKFTGSQKVDTDMDYYGVSGGIAVNGSYSSSVKLRVKMYLNGVRFV